MKSKSIFLMAVSLGFGLIAAIGIRQVLGRSSADNQPKTQMVPVVVAVDDIDASTVLTPEMVTIEEMPIQNAPEGAASSLEDIKGKAIRVRLSRRFPVNLSDLVDEKNINVLSIPPGYKVIGIKVSADGHINGLLQPGDLVDVIGIFRQGGSSGVPLARTFLKKIRVFSVDGEITQDIGRDAKTRSTTVVSVLATQKQSEKLVLVQRLAELKIVMLGKDVDAKPLDYEELAKSEIEDGETTLEDVMSDNSGAGLRNLFNQENSLAQNGASVPVKEFTMRIISNAGVTIHTFGSDGNVKADKSATPTATEGVFPEADFSGSKDDGDSDLFDGDSDIESEEQ